MCSDPRSHILSLYPHLAFHLFILILCYGNLVITTLSTQTPKCALWVNDRRLSMYVNPMCNCEQMLTISRLLIISNVLSDLSLNTCELTATPSCAPGFCLLHLNRFLYPNFGECNHCTQVICISPYPETGITRSMEVFRSTDAS